MRFLAFVLVPFTARLGYMRRRSLCRQHLPQKSASLHCCCDEQEQINPL